MRMREQGRCVGVMDGSRKIKLERQKRRKLKIDEMRLKTEALSIYLLSQYKSL